MFTRRKPCTRRPVSEHARHFSHHLNLSCGVLRRYKAQALASYFSCVMFVGWERASACVPICCVGFCFSEEIGVGRRQEGVRRQPHRRLRVHPRRPARDLRSPGRSIFRRSRARVPHRPRRGGVLAPATAISAAALHWCDRQIGSDSGCMSGSPDVMEGPTPVSALIHAATMVTAGVYMIGRNAVLFSHAPHTLTIVAVIGHRDRR